MNAEFNSEFDSELEENKENILIPSTNWRRPLGPLNVWKVFDAHYNNKPAMFTIQEIPPDRHEEVLKHMCDYYLADEPQFECLNAKNNSTMIYDQKLLWSYFLKQGISIGIFMKNPKEGKSILVGVNLLLIESVDDAKTLFQFAKKYKSPADTILWPLFQEAYAKGKITDRQYLTSAGLSVMPSFRRQSFGTRMLDVRSDICRRFGINQVVGCFSSDYAVKIADHAGYEVLLERDYKEILNGKKEVAFPNCKSKAFKIMFKKFQ